MSWTKVAGASKKQGTITYGPYSDVAPFRNEAAEFHYVSNSPFAVATSVEKKLDVGRWGSLQVDERYLVVRTPQFPHPARCQPFAESENAPLYAFLMAALITKPITKRKMQQSGQQMPCAWRCGAYVACLLCCAHAKNVRRQHDQGVAMMIWTVPYRSALLEH